MQYLSVICVTFFSIVLTKQEENVSVEYYVSLINLRQSSWRAGKHTSITSLNRTLTRSTDPVIFPKVPGLKMKPCSLEGVQIPETFDARKQWPECEEFIGKIRHQGLCNACWAFASTAVMTDRLCIQTKGKDKFEFSPQDLVSCCTNCNIGCKDGYASRAWKHYVNSGIVSGGPFGSYQGCKPYRESEYFHKKKSPCKQECDNPYYNTTYIEDKKFGSEYYLVHKTPECIQAEIMEKGPVHANMMVYDDLYFYIDGVYFYTIGARVSFHGVKIVGWGVERGLPYWLVANSWGCQWGGLKGLFKIRRGHSECGIEDFVLAGNPRIDINNDTYQSSSEHSFVWIISLVLVVSVILILLFIGLSFSHTLTGLYRKYLQFK